MKKWVCSLAIAALFLAILSACGGKEPLEEATELKGNGFTTSYHEYMWTLVGNNATEQLAEASYSHKEDDAFFSVVRIGAKEAEAQGLTAPEGMETLLKTYVTNYGGVNEEITSADTDNEYARELVFTYNDVELNKLYTYKAKLWLDKQSGEMLAVLAGFPNSSDSMVKSEIAGIIENAKMTGMEEPKPVASASQGLSAPESKSVAAPSVSGGPEASGSGESQA